ncbi:type II toxin-antitoxin system Phd/YefM family antitoxin [Microbacterium protaetiae]|uniref:Type II toxin-antitoxin system Phd/YefM family antitoxin n=1 Tax=Microbacterium protaetiae TaxID=2509458 RepID=A0A4P6EDJ8_9MICO|nr:type II toxin-antitoxin system Phd/YefM family antitoxin [Microbacterium protaetiae]QAY59796.1 type II toxin-antitoxin system Phd/YefM family antitoxin [Microbacterium protaetiae]
MSDPVNIHEAKTHFSRLVAAASAGETVLIAKSGHTVAKLTRADATGRSSRLGFLAGQASVPDDFNEMSRDAVADLFEGMR